jgi:hypothetical protein
MVDPRERRVVVVDVVPDIAVIASGEDERRVVELVADVGAEAERTATLEVRFSVAGKGAVRRDGKVGREVIAARVAGS